MANMVKPVPEGYHSVTPYLTIKNAADAIEFYKRAFGAVEEMRVADPSGRIGHAEIRIGDSRIMLSDEFPEMGAHSPSSIGGSPVTIHLYVDDVDATVKQAVAAGATLAHAVEDHFYGDRGGKLVDPYGHAWWVATRKENLTPEEIRRRAAEIFG